MTDVTDTKQLLEMLTAQAASQNETLDSSLIRYALYARKSTTDEGKQVRSVEDQIDECMENIVVPKNLNVKEVYREDFSAKESGTRKEFKRMIEDIKLGRIDGVIAWHPDRLARNMKDAGEIIDLLDKREIEDLRFGSFGFENSPAGKMLLGITFVLAKEYSEKLSIDVKRGNKRKLGTGKGIGKFKHGYYRDKNWYYMPDESNFILVKQMFEMALRGESQKNLREWINTQNYTVQKERGTKAVEHSWTKDNVSNLLRDPHYAGVHKLGDNFVDLTGAYNFTPMITVDEYLEINNIDNLDAAKVFAISKPKSGQIRANFLRGRVYCGICRCPLTSMIIDKKNKETKETYESRYMYKCETKDCSVSGKSARGKLILDEIKQFFNQYLFVTEENYEEYKKQALLALKSKNAELDSAIARTKMITSKEKAEYEQQKELIASNPSLAGHYNLDAKLAAISKIQSEFNDMVATRKSSKSSIPTYEKYLKLFKSIPVILNKMEDMATADKICRIFFSNLTITPVEKGFKQGSIVTYNLKEPWDGFLKDSKFVSGAARLKKCTQYQYRKHRRIRGRDKEMEANSLRTLC